MNVIFLVLVTDEYGTDIRAFYREEDAIEVFRASCDDLLDEYGGDDEFFDYFEADFLAILGQTTIELREVAVD